MPNKDYPGLELPETQSTEFNVLEFMISRLMGRMSTATLVKITKVSNTGTVAAVGQVSVQPLVKMQDSQGKVFSHGEVHNLPYFRYQGGSGKAIILDPKVGDIGIAVFGDRDLSSVKTNKKESQPGSFRRFDMADGMFFGCFLGEAPTCYVQFTDDNKIVISPDNGVTSLKVEAGKITLTAALIDMVKVT